MKALNGRYPLWTNQFSIWPITLPEESIENFDALSFSFALAENRCIVTKFEADNPIAGPPEVFLDNPLAPTHPDNFWQNVLAPHATADPLARDLVQAVTEVYQLWDEQVTRGDHNTYGYGLEDEPYFRYFSYRPFVTPYSGLVQIRKVAEAESHRGLIDRLNEVTRLRNEVLERIYNLLVFEFEYFK